MISELLYARYDPAETRVHLCSGEGLHGRVLIFDLAGEIRTPSLRDRLLSLEVGGRFDHVLLRGVSDFLHAEITDSEGRRELNERFAETPVWLVGMTERPALLAMNDRASAITPLEQERLLASCAHAEVQAALFWNKAIWHDSSYHFVVPSGHHADKFIRIGDIFADPLNVARMADWCAHLAAPPCVLVADTFTLLPLLQGIELRLLRRRAGQAINQTPEAEARSGVQSRAPSGAELGTPLVTLPKYILPLYGVPEDVVRERLAEVVPVARESAAHILALVSVSASGGYVAALREGLHTFAEPPTLRVLALCTTGDAGGTDALCRIPTRSFPGRASCLMCSEEGSTPIEIDQQRLSTRLGVRMLPMPKAPVIEEATLVIRDANPHGAFRVHVDRADRHGHLAVYVDTERLLQSRIFRAKATLGLARTLTGFTPDLVLVPKHDGTAAVRSWVEKEDVPAPIELAIDEALPTDIEAQISTARAILLVDDAVITGRTLNALLEIVQHVRGRIEDGAFELRGFVLVARPASSATWKRLRDRFYIRNQRGLFAAWEVNLPDVGANGREACPWCVEMRFLRNLIPLLPEPARAYAERRLTRLEDPAGLTEAVYLGAEGALDSGGGIGWDPALHTTPGSYLGDVGDVGAFVGMAALLQSMRDAWGSSAERWSMQYAIPLAQFLGRFTDPVIVAGLLRGIAASEVWSGQTEDDLNHTLRALDHAMQHGVLAAEVLLAARQRKLPQGLDTEAFQARLATLPDEIRLGLKALLRN